MLSWFLRRRSIKQVQMETITVTIDTPNTAMPGPSYYRTLITDGKQTHSDYWHIDDIDQMSDWSINVLVAYYNVKFSEAERLVRMAWNEYETATKLNQPVGKNDSDG